MAAALYISYLADPYCSLYGSHLGQTPDLMTSPSPATCVVLSSSIKASHQTGSFLLGINLISPCPMTEVCGVFSSEVLLSSSNGQPRAMAMACIVGGVSRTFLIKKKIKGKCPTAETGLFIW